MLLRAHIPMPIPSLQNCPLWTGFVPYILHLQEAAGCWFVGGDHMTGATFWYLLTGLHTVYN